MEKKCLPHLNCINYVVLFIKLLTLTLDHNFKDFNKYCFKSIAAAHCMVYRDRKFEAQNVRVGLGKMYSNFYRQESSSIISTVSDSICLWSIYIRLKSIVALLKWYYE